MSAEHLDMTLLGREYRISCTAENRDELLATVAYLDDKFRELGVKTNSSGEKLAVMTALNIAHEFLQYQRGNERHRDRHAQADAHADRRPRHVDGGA